MYPKRLNKSWMDDPSGESSINFALSKGKNYQTRVQILTPREPLLQQQKKICPGCNNTLTWLEEQRRFICYACAITYHKDFTSLPTSNDSSIKPLQSVDPYDQIT